MDLTQDLAYGKTRTGSARYIGIVLVIVFHIALVYALVTGLASQAVEIIKGPLETTIIKEAKPPPKELPPPPPQLAPPPPPYIPPPEVQIQSNAPATNAITTVTHALPPKQVAVAPAAPPAPPVKHSIVRPNVSGAGERCKPEYPSVSRDLQEEGTVIVHITVGADGSVSSPQIVQSSGHSRLDKAMLSKLSGCSFPAGKQDGVATAMPADLKYTFRLDD